MVLYCLDVLSILRCLWQSFIGKVFIAVPWALCWMLTCKLNRNLAFHGIWVGGSRVVIISTLIFLLKKKNLQLVFSQVKLTSVIFVLHIKTFCCFNGKEMEPFFLYVYICESEEQSILWSTLIRLNLFCFLSSSSVKTECHAFTLLPWPGFVLVCLFLFLPFNFLLPILRILFHFCKGKIWQGFEIWHWCLCMKVFVWLSDLFLASGWWRVFSLGETFVWDHKSVGASLPSTLPSSRLTLVVSALVDPSFHQHFRAY